MTLTPETSQASPIVVLNDETGVFVYGRDERIEGVGVRPITLAEKVRPRTIARSGSEPDGVVFSLTEVTKNARLNWVLQAGTRYDPAPDDVRRSEPEFFVPWPVWQERSSVPVDAYLPERDGTGVERSLASLERDFRFARLHADDAARERLRVVLVATRAGRSRREVGLALGLSAARVQQLNDDAPAEVVREVDELCAELVSVLGGLGDAPVSRGERSLPPGMGVDRYEEVLGAALRYGLAETAESSIAVTPDGRKLVERHTVDASTRRTAPTPSARGGDERE